MGPGAVRPCAQEGALVGVAPPTCESLSRKWAGLLRDGSPAVSGSNSMAGGAGRAQTCLRAHLLRREGCAFTLRIGTAVEQGEDPDAREADRHGEQGG